MKTKFPILALDHDDTTVNSTPEINYPAFLDTLAHLRPGVTYTYDEFIGLCCHPGFDDLCRKILKFDEKEMDFEVRNWRRFGAATIPSAVPGLKALIERQRAAGGIVAVVSHSMRDTIERDWNAHFGTQPDAIYDWDDDPAKRKPAPFPLLDLSRRYGVPVLGILMIDDLRPGVEMTRAAGARVGAAGWACQSEEVREYMRASCDYYFGSTAELEAFLFDE